MTDFSDHVKILVLYLLPAIALFVVAFSINIARLWQSALVGAAIIVLVIVALARFGGNLGETG